MAEDRFWRVYRLEWVVAYSSDSDGEEGRRECVKRFGDFFAGRVLDREWKVEAWNLQAPDSWPWMLQLLLPVLKGEHVNRPAALLHAREIGGQVALEGSREDMKIRACGEHMLPAGKG